MYVTELLILKLDFGDTLAVEIDRATDCLLRRCDPKTVGRCLLAPLALWSHMTVDDLGQGLRRSQQLVSCSRVQHECGKRVSKRFICKCRRALLNQPLSENVGKTVKLSSSAVS